MMHEVNYGWRSAEPAGYPGSTRPLSHIPTPQAPAPLPSVFSFPFLPEPRWAGMFSPFPLPPYKQGRQTAEERHWQSARGPSSELADSSKNHRTEGWGLPKGLPAHPPPCSAPFFLVGRRQPLGHHLGGLAWTQSAGAQEQPFRDMYHLWGQGSRWKEQAPGSLCLALV